MKTRLLMGLLALTLTFSSAAAELDLAAAAMSGMEASFTHRFTAKGFKNSQVEHGTVAFGPLPRMKWSYTSPERKLFVFDGTTSWFYVPGDRQVTTGRVTDARKREIPFLLIGDPAARQKHFEVREVKRGRSVVTTLKPRDGASIVRSVDVTTSASTHRIERIEYVDRDGNRTSFELSGYKARTLAADAFRFTPPAGVEVIRAD